MLSSRGQSWEILEMLAEVFFSMRSLLGDLCVDGGIRLNILLRNE